MVEPMLRVSSTQQALRSKGVVTLPCTKLAVCLRYLAGGQVLDLKLIYHLSASECYNCVWLGVDAINSVIRIEFPFGDVAKLKVLEAEFAGQRADRCWRGQVACIDGVVFKQSNPGSAVPDPMRYFVARKNEYGLLCIAACDHSRRFVSIDMSMAATTHDSLAHAASDFGKRLAAGDLPYPFFVNGDNAFVAADHMIVPGGTPELDAFDYVQSSQRMPIECAFGILVRRFGCLWRSLDVRFDRRTPLIGACMRLHNYCIDSRISEDTQIINGMGQMQPGRWEPCPKFDKEGRPIEYLNTANELTQRRRIVPQSDARFRRRDELAARIKAQGVVRPALAPGLHSKKKKKKGRQPLAPIRP